MKVGNSNAPRLSGLMPMLSTVLLSGMAWAQSAPPAGAGSQGAGPGGPGGAAPGQIVALEVDRSRECDSACLRAHMDRYLDAYLKHDPSTLQVNPTLRASENSHAVALGDNSWNQVRRILPEKVLLTDPFAGQVLALGVLEMRGAEQFIYSIRLKIENNRISEAELQLVSDKIGGVHFRPDLMQQSYVQLNASVPVSARASRADLLKSARLVWGLDSGVQPARAEKCTHYENWESPEGGSGCRGAGRNPREIRVPLVDVEKGVVVSYSLEDFTTPATGDGPPADANDKLPLFYLHPITFYMMKMARFVEGKFAADHMFMAAQEHGVTTVFRK